MAEYKSNYTKAQYLKTVENKEKYCQILERAIMYLDKKILQCVDNIPLLEVQAFELQAKLDINISIARDARMEYENRFLPEYESRMEACHKNFDEYYGFIKENVEKIPKTNSLYASVVAYPTENPDNTDKDKMLLFFEAIRPVVLMMKK